VLDAAEAARHARLSAGLRLLPEDWPYGEPLRVGHKVAFTGCDDLLREELEQHAERLGVRVMNNVSSRTAMLITDGSFAGGKAADAATLGTRCVHPEEFAILLTYLQPAAKKTAVSVPRPRTETTPTTSTVATITGPPTAPSEISPSAVRAWARVNGFEVGDRGRLPQEVTEAYRSAQDPLNSN
jgi:DNA polymerase-3 subunit epsilon